MTSPHHRRQGIQLTIIALLLFSIIAVLMAFPLSSNRITGMVIAEDQITQVHPLSLLINESQNYTLTLAGRPLSLRATGMLIGPGSATIHLIDDNQRWLVINTTGNASWEAAGSFSSTPTPGPAPPSLITIWLQYNPTPPWDPDDDGIETINGIIDFTVANTRFNLSSEVPGNAHGQDENAGNPACTRWQIISNDDDTTSFLCNGNKKCCEYLGFEPSAPDWDTPYNSFIGRHGATRHTTVGAQVFHLKGNEVKNSSWQYLNATFIDPPPQTPFQSACEESCLITAPDETITLSIEVINAILNLNFLEYAVLSPPPPSFDPEAILAELNLEFAGDAFFINITNISTSSYDLWLELGPATILLRNISDLSSLGQFYQSRPTGPVYGSWLAATPIISLHAEAVRAITIPTDQYVDAILGCRNFDISTGSCDTWQETDISFTHEDGMLSFEDNIFAAYTARHQEALMFLTIPAPPYYQNETINISINMTNTSTWGPLLDGTCDYIYDGEDTPFTFVPPLHKTSFFIEPIGEYLYTIHCTSPSISAPLEEHLILEIMEFISEEIITQEPIKTGEPVVWIKSVDIKPGLPNISILVPDNLGNLTIKAGNTTLGDESITILTKTGEKTLSELQEKMGALKQDPDSRRNLITGAVITGSPSLWQQLKKTFSRITGFAITPEPLPVFNISADPLFENLGFDSFQEIIVHYPPEELEIIFETPEPETHEQIFNPYHKELTIASPFHYQNVRASITFPETTPESVHLYHLVNDTKIPTNITLNDTNGDGNVDYAEWIVPHLSNETYELEITILNPQSYPMVGKNWTVRFNTTGMANLTISAVNGTQWSIDNDSMDLRFLELRCGNTSIETEWTQSSVFVEDYFCNHTSSEISRVNSEGKHHLMFQFGGQIAYAHNFAFGTDLINVSNAFVLYDIDGRKSDSFGEVSATGDFNGDGFSDLLVGVRMANEGATGSVGKAYLYFGNASGTFLSGRGPDKIFKNPEPNANDFFGSSVAAGDINNDGFDDAIIGCRACDANGVAGGGAVFIIYGGPGMPNGTTVNNSLWDPQAVAGDAFSVVATGNFNGDFWDDIVVGAYLAESGSIGNTGAAHIYYGGNIMPNQTRANISFYNPGNESGAVFGAFLATGNFNGDSYDDVVITAYLGGDNDKGKAYVYYGSKWDMVNGSRYNVTLWDPKDTATDSFGYSVAVGDFNGDTYDDALLGAYLADVGDSDEGMAFIFFGGADYMANETFYNVSMWSPDNINGDHFGNSVAAGDFNNDGYDDALIGMQYGNGAVADSGKAYIYFGAPAKGMANESFANITLLDPDSAIVDRFGYGLGVYDFNADGVDDALVSAGYADAGVRDAGKLYIYPILNSLYDYSPKLVLNETTSFDVTVYTYINSTCRYSPEPGTPWANMNAMASGNDLNHTLPLSSLSNGDFNISYVKCNNKLFNSISEDMIIKVGVGDRQDRYHDSGDLLWACEKLNVNTKPVSSVDCTSLATSTDYENIVTDEDTRWVTSGADTDALKESQIFIFNLTDNTSAVRFYWQGYGFTAGSDPGYGTSIGVWNYRLGIWETRASNTFTSAADGNLSFDLTGIGDYINSSGQMAFLAMHEHYAGCFAEDTSITLADGTTKHIQDIKEGDLVLSWNFNEHRAVPAEVTATWEGLHENIYIINEKTRVTQEHPFYTKELGWAAIDPPLTQERHGWLPAALKEGHHIMDKDGNWIAISSIRLDNPDEEMTYNLVQVLQPGSTDCHNNNYFADGVLVHNKLCAFLFSEVDGQKEFEWLLFGVYNEKGDKDSGLVDLREWKENDGYAYIKLEHETNIFELLELPYEIDYIDYLQLEGEERLLQNYSNSSLPLMRAYNLSLVNASDGFDELQYPDNITYNLTSRERIRLVFEELPEKDPRYERTLYFVVKGYYKYFKETKKWSDEPPYNQPSYKSWLSVPENDAAINDILLKNLDGKTTESYPTERLKQKGSSSIYLPPTKILPHHSLNTDEVYLVSTNASFGTVIPAIDWGANAEPHEAGFSYLTQNWIYVNVSVYDDDEVNLTFALYNLSSASGQLELHNNLSFTNGSRQYNFTDLHTANMTYVINVTVKDKLGNLNFTLSRYYYLTAPPLYINYTPKNASNKANGTLIFWCNVTDDFDVQNVSLWANFSKTWQINQTKNPHELDYNETHIAFLAHFNGITDDVMGTSTLAGRNLTYQRGKMLQGVHINHSTIPNQNLSYAIPAGWNWNNMTLSFWLKPDYEWDEEPNLNPGIIQILPNSSVFLYCYSYSGTIECDFDDGPGAARSIVTTNTLTSPANTWLHVVWMWNTTDSAVYVNGKFNATSAYSPAEEANIAGLSASPSLELGYMQDSGVHYYFDGVIDEVAFFNYSLPSDEVLALYNRGSAYRQSNVSFEVNVSPGEYNWICEAYNNNTLRLIPENYSISSVNDTHNPSITYIPGTEDNNTLFNNRSWVYINVSVFDDTDYNLTFYLYNQSDDLIAQAATAVGITEYNFTGLDDNDLYYYNVTAEDDKGQRNTTERRNITLDNPCIYEGWEKNWTVTTGCTVLSQVINLESNLTVNSNGHLVLQNVTLRVNATSDVTKGILIKTGGTLHLLEKQSLVFHEVDQFWLGPTNISSVNERVAYTFITEEKSHLYINRSHLWDVGSKSVSDPLTALYALGALEIENSSFFRVYQVWSYANFTNITDSFFNGTLHGLKGIRISGNDANITNNELSWYNNASSPSIGIHVDGFNATVRGNFVHQINGTKLTGESFGMYFESSAYHLIEGNRFSYLGTDAQGAYAHAIYLLRTNNSIVKSNRFFDLSVSSNNKPYGVTIEDSENIIITNITSTESLFQGIGISVGGRAILVANSTIVGMGTGVQISGKNITVENITAMNFSTSGVTFNGGNNSVLRNSVLKNGSPGSAIMFK
ncbi:MAG: LamG-like jellyroll fold domain-containing protein, partial [Nanoarchaeota archaeon]